MIIVYISISEVMGLKQKLTLLIVTFLFLLVVLQIRFGK